MLDVIDVNYCQKDRIVGYEFVKEFLGCSDTTACKYIKKANELAKKDGIEIFIKGKTTLKYFYLACGICTKVV
ncbi:hypothetical protein [Streptobacillus moniliformis]|uniref:hypothetical protein n=1 Tax=Streptobacillus moniliformis TaxID=34105 RepID=UPI0007E43CF6|nr:hypothetical protein [Streptobacillus moniliformis]QXW65628.1 hypothetical protein KX935_07690 [Streptobacillus moniliformis]